MTLKNGGRNIIAIKYLVKKNHELFRCLWNLKNIFVLNLQIWNQSVLNHQYFFLKFTLCKKDFLKTYNRT